MKTLSIKTSALLIFLLYSGASTYSDDFYGNKEKGWFWYEKIPEPVEDVQDDPAPPLPAPPPAEPKSSQLVFEPAPLSTAWVRENIGKYLDNAIDNPTPENVRAYLYLQRLATDKSFQFMDAVEFATVGDPLLDEISRRGIATFATQKHDRHAGSQRSDLIQRIASEAGLFYFYDESFASEAQSPLIAILDNTHNFTVMAISKDGQQPVSAQFDNIKIDEGHSTKLGITNFPALVLMSTDGNYDVISQGPVSLSDAYRRIIIGAKRLNIVTDEDVNRTRPINNIGKTLANAKLPSSVKQKESGLPVTPKDIVNSLQWR